MSIKIEVYNQNAETVGKVELSEQVFGVAMNEPLIHQAMVTQMANERQPLAHTKDRSEVRGGGRKPWRQKGTGRARAGSNRSPIWMGGGVTFGPRKERNFSKKINKKMKQKALLMVLSDKTANKNIIVLDKLEVKEFKTKAMNEMLNNIEKTAVSVGTKPVLSKTLPKSASQTVTPKETAEGKPKAKKPKRSVLIISEGKDDKIKFSLRNLAGVKIINLNNINILDLLKYRDLYIPQQAIKKIEEKYKSK